MSILHRLSLPLAAAIAAITIAPTRAVAWDGPTHMAIAMIAWDHMTPAARAAAVRLLLSAPADAELASLRPPTGTAAERDRALFALAATWPDIVRASRPAARHAYHHGSWHYVDQYWETAGGIPRPVTRFRSPRQNAGERITSLSRDLAIGSGTRAERGVALAWILHLVGDITQPLHNSSRVTPEDPRGDRGGNTVKLGPQGESLHWFWDRALTISIPSQPGEEPIAYATRLATLVQHDRPRTSLAGRITPGRVDIWEREGLELSQRDVYTPEIVPGQDPPAPYRARALSIAETQVALAGYRLAELLDRVLGS